MKGRNRQYHIFSIWSYLIFFLLICFVVTCNFLFFFNSMELNEQIVKERAPWTLLFIAIMTFIFTLIDGYRRKATIERPIKEILDASEQVMKGNFDVTISSQGLPYHSDFILIIERFNRMIKELSGMETLRSDFIANVSHELKTPLAVIQNYATMLEQPMLSEEDRMTYAVAIHTTTKRFSQLITNILKLNKLENQKIYPVMTSVQLGEALRTCLLDFEEEWEKKELVLDIDIDDIVIDADVELLTLVWNNIISNAIKFTDPKGTIGISLKQEGNWLTMIVRDTGCGMNKETGAHIFEKFYQGDSSHAGSGNGLGLPLVKRVIDILQGRISVESEIGKGSKFIIQLPV